MNSKSKNVTLNELLSFKMAALTMEGKFGTARNYQSVLRQVENQYGIVKIREVTPDFMNDFKRKLKECGVGDSSVAVYFANIRSVWNYALYKRWVKPEDCWWQRHSYEMDRVKFPKTRKRNDRFLEIGDVEKLWNWWSCYRPAIQHQRRKKDYVGLFLASFLGCGANLADILQWSYNRDWFRTGGKCITFVRQKTKGRSDARITVPVTPKLKQIIDDMGAEQVEGGLIFPQFLNGLTPEKDGETYRIRTLTIGSECKKKLRHLAEEIGITTDISPTYARHTFATQMNRIGAPFSLVEQLMGHTLPGVSSHYIATSSYEDSYKWCSRLLS